MNLVRLARRNLLFLFIFSLVTPLLAPPARASATNLHSLWKVEGKRNAVYLLGSVHVLKAEDYPLPAVMEAAFTNSSIAAFETDIDALDQPELQLKLMAKGQLSEGETLPGLLSPDVYKAFTNHLQASGLPLALFSQFKPSMAALTLAALEIQRLGFDSEYGLDKHFYPRARKDGKTIVPLETVEFQIGLATDFTKEEGELLMKVTLEDIDKLKTDFRDLLNAWQTGDSPNLEKMLNEASRQSPAIFKRLVTDRNKRWLPQIEEWLQGDKNAIVIVGAGHLVGDEGVVELLRKKKFKVAQQ